MVTLNDISEDVLMQLVADPQLCNHIAIYACAIPQSEISDIDFSNFDHFKFCIHVNLPTKGFCFVSRAFLPHSIPFQRLLRDLLCTLACTKLQDDELPL